MYKVVVVVVLLLLEILRQHMQLARISGSEVPVK